MNRLKQTMSYLPVVFLVCGCARLDGIFGHCSDSLSRATSNLYSWTVDGDAFTEKLETYDAASCSGNVTTTTMNNSGTFVETGDSEVVDGAKNITITFTTGTTGTFYTIYKLDGDTLYFADYVADEASRPTALRTDAHLTRR